MSFLQGRTPANAIDVEEASSSRPNILYGNEWQEQATGEECLRMNFPEVLEKGTVKIAFGLPTATKKMPVISINGSTSYLPWTLSTKLAWQCHQKLKNR